MIVAAQESFQSLYPHRSRHANHVFCFAICCDCDCAFVVSCYRRYGKFFSLKQHQKQGFVGDENA